MGQELSCPCHNNDSNVYFPDDPEDEGPATVMTMKMPETPNTNPNTGSSTATNPFEVPALHASKSRKWEVVSKEPTGLDNSSTSTQRPGEDPLGDGESHITRDEMESALGNVRGELAFPEKKGTSGQERPAVRQAQAAAESKATRAAIAKQEAHNDRIVATFNSVMLADGLKVLKHHRRSSKKAASRVIRFVPEYGGALVWDKPLRQPGAKASRVPLDAINQVELEQRIVWISAGSERVGFETSKAEDADLMYQAICILVDRCHAA